MTRAAGALVILCAALVGHAQPPTRDAPQKPSAASATTTIRGRVLVTGTDIPVRKARVDLRSDGGVLLDPVYTDDDGRFTFGGVPAGRYGVSAWKSGFVTASFGARTPWEPPVMIAGAANAVVGIQLFLSRGAAISGRVLDEFGEPLVGMSVGIGRMVPANGRLQFQSVAERVETDDLGEYRVGGLPGGAFLVSVFGWPPPSQIVPAGQSLMDRPRPHVVYYPQTTFITQARPVGLRSGEEASGTDVIFGSETATPRISGRIIDPQGQSTNFGISAVSDGNGIPAAASGLTTTVAQSGEFTLPLAPGDYMLVAQSTSGVAMQRIAVDQNDISGLQLVLARGAHISGRVVFDGSAPPPTRNVVVEAWSPDLLRGVPIIRPAGMMGSGRVGANGAFVLTGMIGQREIRVSELPRGWDVESITAGGRSLLDMPMDFKGEEDLRDVTIVLTDQATELSGTVTDANRTPVNTVSLVVFADDRRQLPRRARWVRPDHLGRFVVSGLPPGEYLVVVVEEVDDVNWSTLEYLDRFRSQANRVALGAGEKKSVALEWSAAR